MIRTAVKIEGMTCRMCETRIRDALRRELPVLRVRVSRRRGEAVLDSRDTLGEDGIRATLESLGYRLSSLTVCRREEHPLFSLFHKR